MATCHHANSAGRVDKSIVARYSERQFTIALRRHDRRSYSNAKIVFAGLKNVQAWSPSAGAISIGCTILPDTINGTVATTR